MDAFIDRLDAGRQLALALEEYRESDAHVLGMARGGVAVGFAVAEVLELPLHALVVRKIGAPHNPELALGAVSETGQRWLDPGLVRATGASASYLQQEIEDQVAEAKRRQAEYAVGAGPQAVRGSTAIVVDDGIATGASALVAVRSARDLAAERVVLATPVASPQAVQFLRSEVDQLVVLDTPDPFIAVGLYYRNFEQTTDQEVVDYLQLAHERQEVSG